MNRRTLLLVSVALVGLRLSAQTTRPTGNAATQPSSFLTVEQTPDATVYLPAPPDTSSTAYLQDFARYQWGKGERAKARGAQARFDCHWQTDSILKGYAPCVGFSITRDGMPETFKLMDMVCNDASHSVRRAKQKYMRKRPYVQFHEHPDNRDDEETLRATGSYPSGHSARGWATALVLAELLPDSADAILTRGYQYGESRVIEGYHYQSDVDAARLAASAVVARLHAASTFQKQLALAKKELAKRP